MASTKRARPAFSPPRPGKSKKATAAVSNKISKKSSTSARSNASKSKSKPSANNNKKRKRHAQVIDSDDESASNSSGNEDRQGRNLLEREADATGDEEDDDEANGSASDGEGEEETPHGDEEDLSPDPSVILAEVTREDDNSLSSTNNTCPIPIPLLHRLLHHNFTDQQKTKMSTDAREVVGKYIEIFVREAIMRSNFENVARNTSGAGWLEVEDLERTAVQLCLDF